MIGDRFLLVVRAHHVMDAVEIAPGVVIAAPWMPKTSVHVDVRELGGGE